MNFGDEDAIANFNKATKTVVSNSKYHGPIGAMFRGKDTEKLNNKTRSEFLCALGNAFGLKGIGTNLQGKATFTKDFMTKLQNLLGDEFKAKDFGIGDDGTVTSGKPLTQRRISRIIAQATVVGRGDYNSETYRAKLDVVKAELGKLDPKNGTTSRAKLYFEHVEKCIDFLDNDYDKLIQENPEWSPRRAQNEPDYDVPRFCFYKPGEFDGEPAPTRSQFANYLRDCPIHALYHFEEYKSLPKKLKTPADVKANLDYVRTTTRTYIMGAIDLFLDAKAAGKLDQLLGKIYDKTGACMDAKALKTGEWRKDLGLEIVEDDEIEGATDHGTGTALNDCIYAEIEAANKAMDDKAQCWNDVKDAVKQALVGKTRPITTLSSNGELVPLIENGKQVVRPVTAEDIDKIGQACADALEIF